MPTNRRHQKGRSRRDDGQCANTAHPETQSNESSQSTSWCSGTQVSGAAIQYVRPSVPPCARGRRDLFLGGRRRCGAANRELRMNRGITSNFEGVKRTGPGRHVARCPAHKDRRASLSIRELEDGRWLVHCFAGCPVDAVLDAAGLRIEDLFPERVAAGGGTPPEKRPFSVRELLDALAAELNVAWVLLADLAKGKVADERDRRRAGRARDRCAALIQELTHVR